MSLSKRFFIFYQQPVIELEGTTRERRLLLSKVLLANARHGKADTYTRTCTGFGIRGPCMTSL